MKTTGFLCDDGKYRYVYKITIPSTNQYYIGQHISRIPYSQDKYMGSGTVLKEIYQLSGYNIANKEICCYAENNIELNQLEAALIGDKWKTDPLCLNKVPGGYYKHDDAVRHYVAQYAANVFVDKYKNDIEFRKQWKLNLKKSMDRFRSDDTRFKASRKSAGLKNSKLRQSRKYMGFCQKGENNPNFGKVRIYNPVLDIERTINRDAVLPDGFIYGTRRKKNFSKRSTIKIPPMVKHYVKCLNIKDFSYVFIPKNSEIPTNLIPTNVISTGKHIYVINKNTKQRICIPEHISLPDGWEYSAYYKKKNNLIE